MANGNSIYLTDCKDDTSVVFHAFNMKYSSKFALIPKKMNGQSEIGHLYE